MVRLDKRNKDNSGNDKKPFIVFSRYSPYMAVDVEKLESAKGKDLPLQSVTSLCRCGGSSQKTDTSGRYGRFYPGPDYKLHQCL